MTENVQAVLDTGSAVLVHSIADRVAAVREALAAGAAGVIPKSSPMSSVIGAVATVARGEVLNNLEWASAIDADRDFAKAQLGRRERESCTSTRRACRSSSRRAARHRAFDRTRVPRPHPREVRRGRPTRADEGRPPAPSGGRRHPAGPRPRRRGCPPLNGGSRGSRRVAGPPSRVPRSRPSPAGRSACSGSCSARRRCRSRWRSPRRSSRGRGRP